MKEKHKRVMKKIAWWGLALMLLVSTAAEIFFAIIQFSNTFLFWLKIVTECVFFIVASSWVFEWYDKLVKGGE